MLAAIFFFSSRRRHTRLQGDWSSDVCSSDLLDEVAALGSPLKAVDISKPEVFVGGLLGAMLVFWFSALAISAVTKAAVSVIKEVRRQFQADPGILKGTSRPDYGRAVDIVTVGALKAM